MVFFNCNACGEAVKKNQVEKHYQQQCRKCEVLSCVDCGKEFWGDEYQQHIKCITEEEKFGGKSFKPKPNGNKGEQKQELWTKQVQDAISKTKTNQRLKNLLERLVDHPNIPRKQAKFENFLHNSLRVMDSSLARQAWNAISAELNNGVTKENEAQSSETKKEDDISQKSEVTAADENGKKNKDKKKSKDKKQEQSVAENKQQGIPTEIQNESLENEANMTTKKKKNKKRKVEDETAVEEKAERPKKKKHKAEIVEGNEEQTENTANVAETTTGKFKWEAAIVGVLKRQDDKEISVKKLKKKVLAEYYARGGDGKSYTEEQLLAKFTKKITKNPRLKILKENVKLIS